MRYTTDVPILHRYICSGQKWLISEFRSIYSVVFIIQFYERLGIVWIVGLISLPRGLLTVTCTYDLRVFKKSQN